MPKHETSVYSGVSPCGFKLVAHEYSRQGYPLSACTTFSTWKAIWGNCTRNLSLQDCPLKWTCSLIRLHVPSMLPSSFDILKEFQSAAAFSACLEFYMAFSICLPEWIFFSVAFLDILSCGFIKSIFCFVWTGVCVCAALSCMLDVCHIHLCRSRCSLVILLCHVWRMEMSLALTSGFVLRSMLLFFYFSTSTGIKSLHKLILYKIQLVKVFAPQVSCLCGYLQRLRKFNFVKVVQLRSVSTP